MAPLSIARRSLRSAALAATGDRWELAASADDADVVVRTYDSQGAANIAGVYAPARAEVRVDYACLHGTERLQYAVAHEALHWLTPRRARWSGICASTRATRRTATRPCTGAAARPGCRGGRFYDSTPPPRVELSDDDLRLLGGAAMSDSLWLALAGTDRHATRRALARGLAQTRVASAVSRARGNRRSRRYRPRSRRSSSRICRRGALRSARSTRRVDAIHQAMSRGQRGSAREDPRPSDRRHNNSATRRLADRVDRDRPAGRPPSCSTRPRSCARPASRCERRAKSAMRGG